MGGAPGCRLAIVIRGAGARRVKEEKSPLALPADQGGVGWRCTTKHTEIASMHRLEYLRHAREERAISAGRYLAVQAFGRARAPDRRNTAPKSLATPDSGRSCTALACMRGILATEPTLQRTASAHRPTVPCQTALVGPCVPMALRALCSRPCRILSPLSGHHRSRQHRGTHAVRRIRIYDLAPQPRRADLPHVGLLFQTVVSAALPRTAPSHPLPRAHHTQAQTQPRAVPSSPSAARSCWRSRLQTRWKGTNRIQSVSAETYTRSFWKHLKGTKNARTDAFFGPLAVARQGGNAF